MEFLVVLVFLYFLTKLAEVVDSDHQDAERLQSIVDYFQFPSSPRLDSIGLRDDQGSAAGQGVEGIVRQPEAEGIIQEDGYDVSSMFALDEQNDDVVGPSARREFLQNSVLQQSVMEPDAVDKDTGIATGKQCEISINDFAVLTERSTDSKALDQGGKNTVPTQGESSRPSPTIVSSQIGGVMRPYSSCQESKRAPDHMKGKNSFVYRDASAAARKQGRKNVITRQNIAARSLPQSMPQQYLVVDDIKGKRVVNTEQDDANGSRKQGEIRTSDGQCRINRDVLKKHFGRKLEDVAVRFGVSRSSLKRICRQNGISRWPRKPMPSIDHQVSIRDTQRHIEDAAEGHDTSNIMVKAAYENYIIKFLLTRSSGKLDLENSVGKRLNLSVGNFKIEYFDEEDEKEDWVLVACDDDWRTCMDTCRQLRKTTIRMRVS